MRKFFDDQGTDDAYQLVADARHHATGLYRDALTLPRAENLPNSIAATGVGLNALAIGDLRRLGTKRCGSSRDPQGNGRRTGGV